MNCLFCNILISPANGGPEGTQQYFFCPTCNINALFDKDLNRFTVIILSRTFNFINYTIYLLPHINESFIIFNNNEIAFPYLLNIIPDNIMDFLQYKLPIYKIFS